MHLCIIVFGVLAFANVSLGNLDVIQADIVNDANIPVTVDSNLPADTLQAPIIKVSTAAASDLNHDQSDVIRLESDPVLDASLSIAFDGGNELNISTSNDVINNATVTGSSADTTGVLVDDEDATGESATNGTEKAGKKQRPTKVECLRRNDTEQFDAQELTVQILNHTSHPDLFKTVPNVTVAPCSLILFYAPFCPFSANAAPHFNALARLYPDVPCVAIDASTHVSLNARYGTVALPTLYLFHNGHLAAKFNETVYSLDAFVTFVRKYSSLEPHGTVNVTSADFVGPLSSEAVIETDWLLWLAWAFVIACSCYGITKSSLWHRMLESLRNNWHEAEAQHEHAE